MSREASSQKDLFTVVSSNHMLIEYRGDAEVVEIPEGTCVIGGGVFRRRAFLREVRLPKSLREIDDDAFAGCSNLERVTGECPLTYVGEGAFAGTPWLRALGDRPVLCGVLIGRPPLDRGELAVPEGVRVIAEGVFRGCTELRGITFPESVERIGPEAFADCDHLERVQLPDALQRICGDAFRGCRALREIAIPDGCSDMGWSVFQDCSALDHVVLPKSLHSVSRRMFCNCTSLEEVVIPEAVTSLDMQAFYGCTGLKRIVLSRNTYTVGKEAFSECTSLAEITLPDSLAEIRPHAFHQCTALRRIEIPPHAVMEKGAFAQSGLEEVVLHGASAIPELCFNHCGSLKKVEVRGALQTIGERAFQDCARLQEINLPDSVTEIGDYAFQRCSALRLDLPRGLEKLGVLAFSECNSIREVSIPSPMQSFAVGVFAACKELRRVVLERDAAVRVQSFVQCPVDISIVVPPDHSSLRPVQDGLLLSRDGKRLLWCRRDTVGTVRIPDGVEVIGENAMNECPYITQVILPDSLLHIESFAFAFSDRLQSVRIPDRVHTIEMCAFTDCRSLKTVTLSSGLVSLGVEAFGCTKITEITLPAKLQRVGRHAVWGSPIQKLTVLGPETAYQEPLFYQEPAGMELVADHCSPEKLPASTRSWVRGYFGRLRRGEPIPAEADKTLRAYIRRHCQEHWEEPLCLRGMLEQRLLPAGKVDAALEVALGSGDTNLVTDLLEYRQRLRETGKRTKKDPDCASRGRGGTVS